MGIAQVQQPAIRHAAHVRSVDGAEGGEGLVPGGPRVGDGRDRFRADRVGGVVVAGQFPPGADGAGAFLPVQPVQRMLRDRSERVDGPGQGILGGVLGEAVLAGVHQRGDLRDVGAAFGVGEGGDLRGPRARGSGTREPVRWQRRTSMTLADVAGFGQVPLGDRGGQDSPGVQAGQLGGAHRPPQPPGLVAGYGR